jgi:excreted virulence factor EspC (type VII ESX diderm)
MGDGFEILSGELDGHAGKVDALTDRMRTAVDAANTVTMNNDAYGVVCQPFAMLLQPFEEWGVRTLQQAADALEDSAKKVRDTVAAYAATDTEESAVYKGIGDEI